MVEGLCGLPALNGALNPFSSFAAKYIRMAPNNESPWAYIRGCVFLGMAKIAEVS